MTKAKPPKIELPPVGFSIYIEVGQDGQPLYDIVLAPGYERYLAEILFAMSQGSIGVMLLGLVNEKYPEQAKLINMEIELMGKEMLETSGYNIWLQSDVVDSESVFGGQHNNQQGNG